MMDRLTEIVAEPGEREIRITRELDAPRDLVFKVVTDPKLIPDWWGPSYLTTRVEEMDVRPGGAWRFVQRDPQGEEYSFYGEYREVVPPERVVQTFEFGGMPGHVSVETLVLEEHDGKTIWRATSVFDSVEDRDGMIQSGMEEGMREMHERLAAILAQLRSKEESAERRVA